MQKPDSELSIATEITHPDGLIVVTEDDLDHMLSGHFSPDTPGSKFTTPFEGVMNEVKSHLPDTLEYGTSEDIHIEIECDRIIGVTGIARRVDLYNAAIIDADTFRHLDETESEIFVRNLLDTEEEKQVFVDGFNKQYATEHCSLTVRGNTICVLVEKELSETSSFVAILNPSTHPDARHRLVTMFPGPDMPRLPGDEYFRTPDTTSMTGQKTLQTQQHSANRRWSEFAFLQPPK